MERPISGGRGVNESPSMELTLCRIRLPLIVVPARLRAVRVRSIEKVSWSGRVVSDTGVNIDCEEVGGETDLLRRCCTV